MAVVASSLGLVVAGSPSIGQEKQAGTKKTEKAEKAKRRLPSYYADVVSEEQREKIYNIQEKYAKELKALNEQLLAVTKKQNDEIEAVLTAEQKEKIDLARANTAAKKKKKAADKQAAESAKTGGAATTKTN